MRSRYIFVTILSAIIFAAIFVLRAAGSLPQRDIIPTDAAPDIAAVVEPVEGQIGEHTPITTTVEPVVIQGTQRQDGTELLEAHCTQCHTAQMLVQINQPREDWEKALIKMEGFGVHLDESEKAVLLDYLTRAEQP